MNTAALVIVPPRLPAEESHDASKFDGLQSHLSKIYYCESTTTLPKMDALECSPHEAKTSPLERIQIQSKLGVGGTQKLIFKSLIEDGTEVVLVMTSENNLTFGLLNRILSLMSNNKTDAILVSPNGKKISSLGLFSRISSRSNNFLSGSSFLNWHSPICAYSKEGLELTNFLQSPNGQGFSTDLLLQMKSAGVRILEIQDKNLTARVVKISDAFASLAAVLRHRIRVMGFAPSYVIKPSYRFKFNAYSSHSQIAKILKNSPLGKILDLGCADGQLSEIASSHGHKVTAIDMITPESLSPNVNFIQHNLENGLPRSLTEKFDLVLCADILEHLRNPDILLSKISSSLTDNGVVLVSIPNFGHWYPRVRVLLGKFDYDSRGILDQSHLRFFSRKSFIRISSLAGFDTKQVSMTGTPFEVMLREAPQRRFSWKPLLYILSKSDRILCKIRPNLFAYQFIFELKPRVSGSRQ